MVSLKRERDIELDDDDDDDDYEEEDGGKFMFC